MAVFSATTNGCRQYFGLFPTVHHCDSMIKRNFWVEYYFTIESQWWFVEIRYSTQCHSIGMFWQLLLCLKHLRLKYVLHDNKRWSIELWRVIFCSVHHCACIVNYLMTICRCVFIPLRESWKRFRDSTKETCKYLDIQKEMFPKEEITVPIYAFPKSPYFQ